MKKNIQTKSTERIMKSDKRFNDKRKKAKVVKPKLIGE